MTRPTDEELERTANHCDLAAKVMAQTGTFETGQSILIEAAALLRACKGRHTLAKAAQAVLDAADAGQMVERGSVGGMTIDAQIRGAVYNGVAAWPFEELREALAAIEEPAHE